MNARKRLPIFGRLQAGPKEAKKPAKDADSYAFRAGHTLGGKRKIPIERRYNINPAEALLEARQMGYKGSEAKFLEAFGKFQGNLRMYQRERKAHLKQGRTEYSRKRRKSKTSVPEGEMLAKETENIAIFVEKKRKK